MMLTFGEYTRDFLDASAQWFADPEILKLTNTPAVSDEQRELFYNSLSTRSDYKIWGISYNEVPIGACGLKSITNIDAEYWGFIGEKEFWSRGYGKCIVEFCNTKAREMGLSSLYLYVIPENQRAICLYLKQGFQYEMSQKENLLKMSISI